MEFRVPVFTDLTSLEPELPKPANAIETRGKLYVPMEIEEVEREIAQLNERIAYERQRVREVDARIKQVQLKAQLQVARLRSQEQSIGKQIVELVHLRRTMYTRRHYMTRYYGPEGPPQEQDP